VIKLFKEINRKVLLSEDFYFFKTHFLKKSKVIYYENNKRPLVIKKSKNACYFVPFCTLLYDQDLLCYFA